MNDIVVTAFTVSGISISVIFLVLTILIFTIRLLVHFIPFQEPPPRPAKKSPPAAAPINADTDEDIAVITSVMASHLGQTSGNLQVVNIQSR